MNKAIKSLSGGLFISIGTYGYLITLSKTNNVFLASMVFFLGLMLILITETNLFTGQVFTKANLPTWEYIETLVDTWFFNFFGASLGAILLSFLYSPNINQIISNKLSLTMPQLILSGIFCNIMVCSAIYTYQKTNNLILSGFIITVFVLFGFEHSIANMVYLTVGAGEGLVSVIEYCRNIFSVTLGNVIGGLIFYKIIENNLK